MQSEQFHARPAVRAGVVSGLCTSQQASKLFNKQACQREVRAKHATGCGTHHVVSRMMNLMSRTRGFWRRCE